MKITKAIAKKILAILLVGGGAVTVVGGAVFGIGVAAAGGDFTALNTVEYQTKTWQESSHIRTLIVDYSVSDIRVYFTKDATHVRVEYDEEYTKKGKCTSTATVTESGETLKIVENRTATSLLSWSVAYTPKVAVYIPESRALALDIETETGDVLFSGEGSFTDLEAETETGSIRSDSAITVQNDAKFSTETGSISLAKLTAQSLAVETETGSIRLTEAIAITKAEVEADTGSIQILALQAQTARIEGDTGSITLGNITADELSVKNSTGDVKSKADTYIDSRALTVVCNTGDIRIRLVGKYADYAMQVKTSTGKANIYPAPANGQPRSLSAKTSTGDIHVTFQTEN